MPREVWEVSVAGNEYPGFLCVSEEVGRRVAEREYPDYFGKPILWEKAHSGCTLGVFYSHASCMETVYVIKREILEK